MHQLNFTHTHSYAARDTGIAVPIVLRSGVKAIDVIATLDTGESHCLFEAAYAAQLGLDLPSGLSKRFRIANSAFESFGHEVEIDVFGILTHSLVYFFADQSIIKNVLGREGWLDRVRLGVVDHDRALYLAAYDHD